MNAALDRLDPRRSALVLVDYQQRLLPALHRGAQALAQAARLADIARLLGVPVVGTEQNPAGLGPNDDAVAGRCDETLAKMHFDACEDGLALRLQALGAAAGRPLRHVVVAGCEAHVCLLQTALGLLRAGHGVQVVAEACASRSAGDHALAMQRLRQAGAVIASVESVSFEWLRSCRHERFRDVLAMVRQRLPD